MLAFLTTDPAARVAALHREIQGTAAARDWATDSGNPERAAVLEVQRVALVRLLTSGTAGEGVRL